MSTMHQPTYPLPSRVLDSLRFARLRDFTSLWMQARCATMTLLEGTIERPDGYWRDSDFRAVLRVAVSYTVHITDDMMAEHIEYGEESE